MGSRSPFSGFSSLHFPRHTTAGLRLLTPNTAGTRQLYTRQGDKCLPPCCLPPSFSLVLRKDVTLISSLVVVRLAHPLEWKVEWRAAQSGLNRSSACVAQPKLCSPVQLSQELSWGVLAACQDWSRCPLFPICTWLFTLWVGNMEWWRGVWHLGVSVRFHFSISREFKLKLYFRIIYL